MSTLTLDLKEIVVPGNVKIGREQQTRMQTLNEKKQIECDIKAANIILQWLPNDIYTLLCHMKTANAIWYRVKKPMEDIKLTKQEMETKLAGEFKKFTSEKRETIQPYYLKFAKLMNDINIKHVKVRT
ncbi:hypothetical protein Tco_1289888 [Tanacetum coccineum]